MQLEEIRLNACQKSNIQKKIFFCVINFHCVKRGVLCSCGFIYKIKNKTNLFG